MPGRGHSEQWIRDKLARAEAQQAQLIQAASELAAELADLRRALSPGSARHTKPRPPRQPRRAETTTDRWLRSVKVVAAIAACITLALVAMAPRHVRDQQYTRRGTVQVVNHSPDPRKTGG
jgi:ferric-dicitrate binding protein FerR (iron transport regulator)